MFEFPTRIRSLETISRLYRHPASRNRCSVGYVRRIRAPYGCGSKLPPFTYLTFAQAVVRKHNLGGIYPLFDAFLPVSSEFEY